MSRLISFMLLVSALCLTSLVSAAETTVTLSPTRDTFIAGSSNPESNFGVGPEIKVYRASTAMQNTLIHFDLSSIPSGSRIVSANLELTTTDTRTDAPMPVSVHYVTESWVEGTGCWEPNQSGATWTTRDGTTPWTNGPSGSFDPAAVASTTVDGAMGTVATFDVTNMVQAWKTAIPTRGSCSPTRARTTARASSPAERTPTPQSVRASS